MGMDKTADALRVVMGEIRVIGDGKYWTSAVTDSKASKLIADHGPAIAQALEDARRYRWLRISAKNVEWNDWVSYSPGYSHNGPEILDAAIDAAVATTEQVDAS